MIPESFPACFFPTPQREIRESAEKGGFEIEELFDEDPVIEESPLGSPTKSNLPHIRFNPAVQVMGLRDGKRILKTIKLQDEASGKDYHYHTGFSNSYRNIRLLGHPSDTYGSERRRLEQRALYLERVKVSRQEKAMNFRRMQQSNQAEETFTREELTDLLESASRKSDKAIHQSSTREILARFRRFAAKRSKFPYAEPGVRIRPHQRGKTFTIEYAKIPEKELKVYDQIRLLEQRCYSGDLDQLIPKVAEKGAGRVIFVKSDRLSPGLDGFIALTITSKNTSRAFHFHILERGEVLATRCFKNPYRQRVYTNLNSFLKKHSLSLE